MRSNEKQLINIKIETTCVIIVIMGKIEIK
jgi:hypothetical protein